MGSEAETMSHKSSPLAFVMLETKHKFEEQLQRCIDYNLLSDKTCRLFAVWSYRDTLNWVKNPDVRSIHAADVAERYAYGEATQEDLSAAWSAASAAESAASAAESAASAAESAASAASAAWSAAWSAASAAESAVRSAAWSAAESAAWSAASAAEERQKQALIRLINEELGCESST